MNKNYKNKKRIAVVVLSALAVCLAVCLAWYVGTIGKPGVPAAGLDEPVAETVAAVPEESIGTTTGLEEKPGTGNGEKTTPEAGLGQGTESDTRLEQAEGLEPGPGKASTVETSREEASLEEEAPIAEAANGGEAEKRETTAVPVGSKPQDAVQPSEPPAGEGSDAGAGSQDGDAGASQPGHTQPREDGKQGEGSAPEGMVYVPGFGYIESSGPNHQETSHAEGDWDKQIGTMQ